MEERELSMDTDLNHITLTGVLERDPITKFADHGTQQVPFTLKIIEPGPCRAGVQAVCAGRGVQPGGGGGR
jgi:hypothetical protein